jgi:hypothetical protein
MSNWPPVWTPRSSAGASPDSSLKGEIGTLKELECESINSKNCSLVIEHGNQDYISRLVFDDGMFCWLTCAELKKHIGKSLKEIGDLDLP